MPASEDQNSDSTRGPDPAHSDGEYLRLVAMQPGGFATAPEIAPMLSVGEKQTNNKLQQLVDKGLLNTRRAGRTNVYWLSDTGERELLNE